MPWRLERWRTCTRPDNEHERQGVPRNAKLGRPDVDELERAQRIEPGVANNDAGGLFTYPQVLLKIRPAHKSGADSGSEGIKCG